MSHESQQEQLLDNAREAILQWAALEEKYAGAEILKPLFESYAKEQMTHEGLDTATLFLRDEKFWKELPDTIPTEDGESLPKEDLRRRLERISELTA